MHGKKIARIRFDSPGNGRIETREKHPVRWVRNLVVIRVLTVK